jgi:hypothetical protein
MNRMRIRNKDGEIVPFRLNRAQLRFAGTLKKREAAGEPMWAIVLKARRVGISTFSEGLLTAHCLSTPNARAMILAHKFKSSEVLFDIARRMRESVAEGRIWMPPGTLRHLNYPGSGGHLAIQTAGSTTSGRGMSLSAIHFSEAAFYPGNAESLTSLLPAVPKKPGTIVIIESTANGKEGDGATFYKLWMAAIEGRNDFTPVFIPWTEDPDCVGNPLLAEDAPMDDEEEELMQAGVTKAQLSWRRMTIESECQGSEDIFHQEYPGTWQEAFIGTGRPGFNRQELKNAAKYINPPRTVKPIATLRLDRDLVSDRTLFTPDKKRGMVMWEKPRCGDDPDRPKPATHSDTPCSRCHRYYIGADVARSADEHSDYSALTIFNGTTGDQAARLSGRIDPVQLADQIEMIGTLYNNAMVVIELTGGLGMWTQKTLRDVWHYPNIYRWKSGKDDSLPGKGVKQALGWTTTYDSRKLLFSAFREALRYEKIRIYDPILLAQIEAAYYDEDGRWELDIGHDDVLVSAMLSWIAVMQYPPAKHLKSRVADPEVEAANRAMDDEDLPVPISRIQPDVQNALRRHFRLVRRERQEDRLAGI